MCCNYCKAAGKSEEEWSSHWVKDKVGGKVVCPALLANECGYCHAVGHTPKFCPKLKARDARRAARKRCQSSCCVKPPRNSLAGFAAPAVKQMRHLDMKAAAQKRAWTRCTDNQYAALMGVGPVQPRRKVVAKPVVKGPAVAKPRAPQGAWGGAARVAEAARNLDHNEVEQLRVLLSQMGITGPSTEEQAWLDQQLVDLEEETAEGEAFFDNVMDAEDAVMAMDEEEEEAIALPASCDLDADFGPAGSDGWGSEDDDL